MKIFKRFKIWWRGKRIPSFKKLDGYGGFTPKYEFFDKYEQYLIVKMLISIGHFWIRHWKFIIGTFITLIGFAVALFIHYDKP